jgi:lysophospholipid hydrolase
MADVSPVPSSTGAVAAASSLLENSSRATYNMSTTNLLTAATGTLQAQIDVNSSRSLIGMLGHAAFSIAKLVPRILYWVVTFTTITLPSYLFSLFSTSLTFTMNATTL